jgi:hypothetical protein
MPAMIPTRPTPHRKAAFAVAVLAASSGACALTDLTLNVPAPAQVTAGTKRGGGREIAVVPAFTDRRPQRHRCGMKKNGYNMDTANIFCATPPYVFLANLLRAELAAAGFRVVSDPRAVGGSTVVISGELQQFFVEPKIGAVTFSPETDIGLKLTATTGTGLYAERRFYVKGEEVSLAGTDGNLQLAYEAAIRQMMRATVDAITNLVDQFPPTPGAPAVTVSMRLGSTMDGGER